MGVSGAVRGRAKCIVVLVEKREGMIPRGRPRCRWKDNIKIDVKEIQWQDTDCINVAQVKEK
jgi:hypothetical protein